MVSCGPLGEPPETENIDRREKFFAYTSLPSLQAYILVAQDKIEVSVFRRAEPGWGANYLETRESVLRLDVIGLELPLSVIYDRVF